jgi:hypothetical protein
MQLDGTNLYLTGEDGGAAPNGDTDQRLVTTSDETGAIAFSAATDGNGQVTFVSADGTTLFVYMRLNMCMFVSCINTSFEQVWRVQSQNSFLSFLQRRSKASANSKVSFSSQHSLL